MDILSAVRAGNQAMVKYMISVGANVDALDEYGNTPLFFAAYNNDMTCMRLLIDVGANPNIKVNEGTMSTPLHWAAFHGNFDMTTYLVSNGAIVNVPAASYGHTPLHTAAHHGKSAIARYLIGQNADLNALTTSGCSALHLAAKNGDLQMVKILVTAGTNLYLKNDKGRTAFEEIGEGRNPDNPFEAHFYLQRLLVTQVMLSKQWPVDFIREFRNYLS